MASDSRTDEMSLEDTILAVYHGLVLQGKVMLRVKGAESLFLQLKPTQISASVRIDDDSVPILLVPKKKYRIRPSSDISMLQVIKFINGVDPVYRIEEKSQVSSSILKQCLHILLQVSNP